MRPEVACVRRVSSYDAEAVRSALPPGLFDAVRPGDFVLVKPNWVKESHGERPDDWDYVVTHPAVVTAVLRELFPRLRGGGGRVVVADGPTTEASFTRLIARYPVTDWREEAAEAGVPLEVVDLRDDEWEMKDGVIISRRRLGGDPRGKVLFDLHGEASEFHGHARSRKGYYAADYDTSEVNRAHDGTRNLYSVSGSAMACDVFVNLPKLKTHRKAGITACLKNLVGINTYKNYLPHHSEGGPYDSGDQFPCDRASSRIEGRLMTFLRAWVLRDPRLARFVAPFKGVGEKAFGPSKEVVRSGNWHGNDTLWRTIVDLNKILLYGRPDGTMAGPAASSPRRYIAVVDAVRAGEGFGPLSPEPIGMGRIVCGTNPVSVDAACAALMGFDAARIPAIAKSFEARGWPLCGFPREAVRAEINGAEFALDAIPMDEIVPFEPVFGWKGRIEGRGWRK